MAGKMSAMVEGMLGSILPELLRQRGVPVPQGFGPEHVSELLDEVAQRFGTAKPKEGYQGPDLLKTYWRNQTQVSDQDFRTTIERVFDDERFTEVSNKLLAACAVIADEGAKTAQRSKEPIDASPRGTTP